MTQTIPLVVLHQAADYTDYYDRIHRYTLSLVRDAAEAEDLTQETFLRAYQHRDALRDAHAQLAWLYQIATRICVDRLRQRKRRAPLESAADVTEVEVADTHEPSVRLVTEQHEMSACVQQYLARVPDKYRAVILLHDVQKLTAAEIAALLGISVSNVKMRLHRARLALKTALEEGCSFTHDERGVFTCEVKQ